ncbi:hypothetical protein [Streptomyces sp. AP-93]|uniref:hypothetical protein n=1 Tax=Streptomyces sp. AP-93 TaxID=2929048 RepID=UPI001FAE90E7|nr:hypothetical protein [Streptomyces sp. AP-93]MCJ0874033.1 hypothetical protein [Streptomyces sp. AP-93]
MTTQSSPDDSAWEAKRRRAGVAAFLAATAASFAFFAFFAFFPGLPHVIDWGAVITSLAVGALARWARQSHMTRKHTASR